MRYMLFFIYVAKHFESLKALYKFPIIIITIIMRSQISV